MMDAAELTRRLGGKWSARKWYGVACCPAHDDANPSLIISDGDRGLRVHCLAGCEWRDVLDALRRRGSMDGCDPQPRRPSKPTPDTNSDRAATARWLWSKRRPIAGSIAEQYLREARGYTGPLPATLAFLPPSKPEHHPAMIAAFAVPDEPHDVSAVHLTLLKPDGSGKAVIAPKPNKLFVGSPSGRPIVLAPPNGVLGLAITEGIEDALSVHQATGLGAWAAGCAGMMSKLAAAVPDYIDRVTIVADPDPAGQGNARKLSAALGERGIEFVNVLLKARRDDAPVPVKELSHEARRE